MRVTRNFRAGLLVVSVAAATPLALAAVHTATHASVETKPADNIPAMSAQLNANKSPLQPGDSEAVSSDVAPSHIDVSINGVAVPVSESGNTHTTITDEGTRTTVDAHVNGEGDAASEDNSGSGHTRTTTRVRVNSRTKSNNSNTQPANDGPITLTYRSGSDQSTP